MDCRSSHNHPRRQMCLPFRRNFCLVKVCRYLNRTGPMTQTASMTLFCNTGVPTGSVMTQILAFPVGSICLTGSLCVVVTFPSLARSCVIPFQVPKLPRVWLQTAGPSLRWLRCVHPCWMSLPPSGMTFSSVDSRYPIALGGLKFTFWVRRRCLLPSMIADL